MKKGLGIWDESRYETIPDGHGFLNYSLCCVFEEYREGTSTLPRVVADHFGGISL